MLCETPTPPSAAQVLAGAAELAFAAQRLKQSSPCFRQPLPLLGSLYGRLKSQSEKQNPARFARPLTPTLSPQAGRGSKRRAPRRGRLSLLTFFRRSKESKARRRRNTLRNKQMRTPVQRTSPNPRQRQNYRRHEPQKMQSPVKSAHCGARLLSPSISSLAGRGRKTKQAQDGQNRQRNASTLFVLGENQKQSHWAATQNLPGRQFFFLGAG